MTSSRGGGLAVAVLKTNRNKILITIGFTVLTPQVLFVMSKELPVYEIPIYYCQVDLLSYNILWILSLKFLRGAVECRLIVFEPDSLDSLVKSLDRH